MRLPSRNRNALLMAALAIATFTAAPAPAGDDDDLADIGREVAKRHDEAIARLRDWIGAPAIAAEDRGFPDGAERMAKLARDAGFQQATVIQTEGKPGVGKVIVGRGAVNQKGPQAALLAALHAIRGAGRKMPVNLVLVAEGEEEIGSPHIVQLAHRPEVTTALRRSVGVFMPSAQQDLDGVVTVSLGAKGVVELELVASGEKWGRGPGKDIHSSLKAMVDSPAWRLVKALDTLVSADGNTVTIAGYPTPRPISKAERAMVAEGAKRRSEANAKKQYSVQHWIDDLPWQRANEGLVSQPTVNIQGLVGGYTGPGGKTVLPHRAVAKIDLRLVPGMTKDAAVSALRAHLVKEGYGDIEVNVTGGYDPTSTAAESRLIQAQLDVLKRAGIEPVLWPRNAGSYPGFAFTGAPLEMASGHFGLGHGSGAHAPDEYYVIESTNPAIRGFDGAAMSFVEYLYELAR